MVGPSFTIDASLTWYITPIRQPQHATGEQGLFASRYSIMVLGILDSISNIGHHALSSVSMENRGDASRIPAVFSTPLDRTSKGFVCLLRRRHALVNSELCCMVYLASQSFKLYLSMHSVHRCLHEQFPLYGTFIW